MDNRVLQIQNRTCRVYGTVGAEYLLLQMADEHDPAGMERETEAIRRQTARPFLRLLSQWKIGMTTYRLGPHRLRGASMASAAGQRIRWRGWSRLCRTSADSIL